MELLADFAFGMMILLPILVVAGVAAIWICVTSGCRSRNWWQQ